MTGIGYFCYLMEMLLPTIGLLIPMKKRKHGIRNGALVFLIGNFIFEGSIELLANSMQRDRDEGMGILSNMTPISSLLVLVWFLISWGVLLLCIYCVAEAKLRDCIYVFAISYAVEHIFYCLRSLVAYISGGKIDSAVWWLYGSCLLASFLVAYFCFAKGACYHGTYQIHMISAVGSTFAILLVVWALSIWASDQNIVHIHAIYASIACIFILHNQKQQLIREKERSEFAQKEQIWEKSIMRYQISKDAMNVVNQQYHDMKHKIHALANMENTGQRDQYLSEMENQIAEYDAVVRTGNTFLDTVLTEKKLACRSREIGMSCIADGSLLSFMDELDLYTLFGNALDNAIEANDRIEDTKKRWISVQIQNKKGIILAEIMNPFIGTIEYEGDLPKTTKEDSLSHGYGVASIKEIVEKYGGQLVIKEEHNKYLLRIVFQKK